MGLDQDYKDILLRVKLCLTNKPRFTKADIDKIEQEFCIETPQSNNMQEIQLIPRAKKLKDGEFIRMSSSVERFDRDPKRILNLKHNRSPKRGGR